MAVHSDAQPAPAAGGLGALDEQSCLDLLATVPLGRVVFTDQALPAIQPINFVLDGKGIAIRTGPDSRLARATRNTVVAFEADYLDDLTGTGWTVTVVGKARPVRSPADRQRLSALPLRPWGASDDDVFIRITIDHIAGHTLRLTLT